MKISDAEIDAAHTVLMAFQGDITKALTHRMIRAALKVRKRLKRERETARELSS